MSTRRAQTRKQTASPLEDSLVTPASLSQDQQVTNPPAPFLLKTYELINDRSTDDIVSWGANGRTFVVWKPPELGRDVLPHFFKHNNFQSFVRQLNTYGFRKVDPDRWEFSNELFIRGRPHLLSHIQRRKPAGPEKKSSPALDGGPVVELGHFGGIVDDLESLKRDKCTLMQEVLRLRVAQLHQQREQADIQQRMAASENRQAQLLTFLTTALQNPQLIPELSSTGTVQRALANSSTRVKRRAVGDATEDTSPQAHDVRGGPSQLALYTPPGYYQPPTPSTTGSLVNMLKVMEKEALESAAVAQQQARAAHAEVSRMAGDMDRLTVGANLAGVRLECVDHEHDGQLGMDMVPAGSIGQGDGRGRGAQGRGGNDSGGQSRHRRPAVEIQPGDMLPYEPMALPGVESNAPQVSMPSTGSGFNGGGILIQDLDSELETISDLVPPSQDSASGVLPSLPSHPTPRGRRTGTGAGTGTGTGKGMVKDLESERVEMGSEDLHNLLMEADEGFWDELMAASPRPTVETSRG